MQSRPSVVYIRKVKKSESKSQRVNPISCVGERLCISVKLKNLKANHNPLGDYYDPLIGCVYP